MFGNGLSGILGVSRRVAPRTPMAAIHLSPSRNFKMGLWCAWWERSTIRLPRGRLYLVGRELLAAVDVGVADGVDLIYGTLLC